VIEVRPEAFTLVGYDHDEVRRIVEEAAARVGATDVVVEIDESLPLPITGFTADVVDGRGSIWISGGSLENGRVPTTLHPEHAATELTAAMLRIADRMRPEFADASPEQELTDRDRAAWETWAYGRCARMGLAVREQRSRYAMRLYHGFTDTTDAAFERLWSTDDLAWDDLVELGRETAAVDPRPPTKEQRTAMRAARSKAPAG